MSPGLVGRSVQDDEDTFYCVGSMGESVRCWNHIGWTGTQTRTHTISDTRSKAPITTHGHAKAVSVDPHITSQLYPALVQAPEGFVALLVHQDVLVCMLRLLERFVGTKRAAPPGS
ncbi:hypothetical protein K7X08_015061 [Anisodus acutangulus]|uniref:Uncharacterized protein n=1 Tax=Anisodus acutangulus TaxID=402998 RepID=A0A9Q1QUI8_9SOLA|nr:hypothetical protein K7X08_015061 [Anisodus acutangulus]